MSADIAKNPMRQWFGVTPLGYFKNIGRWVGEQTSTDLSAKMPGILGAMRRFLLKGVFHALYET
jgi:hypothetical protein